MLDFKMAASFLSTVGHCRVKKTTRKNRKLLLNRAKFKELGKRLVLSRPAGLQMHPGIVWEQH